MAQLEEKLGALLSDEEGRQRFLQLASMLSGSGASSSDQTSAENNEQAAPISDDAPNAADTEPSQPDKTGVIFEALPKLLQALSGSGEGLDSKKVNLIRAISPYLNDTRSQYIDRAIRMASVAKAARDTLGLLGR